MQQWYSSLNGESGFSEEAFISLEAPARQEQEAGRQVICSLMLDEMPVKKNIEGDDKRFVGVADLGMGHQQQSELAVEVLLFMVVAVNGPQKVPIAHFLVGGLIGPDKGPISPYRSCKAPFCWNKDHFPYMRRTICQLCHDSSPWG